MSLIYHISPSSPVSVPSSPPPSCLVTGLQAETHPWTRGRPPGCSLHIPPRGLRCSRSPGAPGWAAACFVRQPAEQETMDCGHWVGLSSLERPSISSPGVGLKFYGFVPIYLVETFSSWAFSSLPGQRPRPENPPPEPVSWSTAAPDGISQGWGTGAGNLHS